MGFRISGKALDVGDVLPNRIRERIDELVKRFFDRGYSGHAIVSKEGFGFRTECAIHLDSGVVLHAEGMAADAYASADQAALQIEKRLRRYRERLKSHSGRLDGSRRSNPTLDALSYVIAAPDEEQDTVDFSPAIIAESTTALETSAGSTRRIPRPTEQFHVRNC